MERIMTYDDWFIEKDINDRYFLYDKDDEEIYEVELIKTIDITDLDPKAPLEEPYFDYSYSGEFDYAEKEGRFIFGYFNVIGEGFDFSKELSMIVKKYKKASKIFLERSLNNGQIDDLLERIKNDLNYTNGNTTLSEYIGFKNKF